MGWSTGCLQRAALYLQWPPTQRRTGQGCGAGGSLWRGVVARAVAAGGKTLVPGPPSFSSLYTHTQKGLNGSKGHRIINSLIDHNLTI